MVHWNRVAVKRCGSGVEDYAGIECGHYPLTASAHVLIPHFQAAAILLSPIFVQVDEDVNASFEAQRRVEIEVGMDVKMTTVADLVEAGPGEMRIRDQALDTGQVLKETDEWNRVE